MRVRLLYGREGLNVDLPITQTTLLRANEPDPLSDPAATLRGAIRSPIGCAPLRDLVNLDDQVAIVFSDITRPMPNSFVLPILLDELNVIPDDQIVLINALGTHRPNTPGELDSLLGVEIASRYRIVQPDCRNTTELVSLGTSKYGHEIWINRVYMESSVKILTGFIEPHLFAGFSGGPKAVLPGVAGFSTIMANHGSDMIDQPGVGFGTTYGNPIWEEMLEAALITTPTFLLNVTLNDSRQLTGVFAGDLEAAHQAGASFVSQMAMVPVSEPYDLVLVTAGGYPLDISMYQSVKGIAVAGRVVKQGGTILLAAQCEEGLPDYGEYGSVMSRVDSPTDLVQLIRSPHFQMQDQWDAQIQAQICQRSKLLIYSDGLTDEEIRQVLGEPCRDIPRMLADWIDANPNGRIGVLPAGPLAIPHISENNQ